MGLCRHTEHATRGDGRYGRFFDGAGDFGAGEWEPCSVRVQTTEPTRWRKRPVVIDAMQLRIGNAHDVADWCGGKVAWVKPHVPAVDIKTLEGTMRANVGWWVIKGVQGEYYPCDPDIFEATYEAVDG